MQQFLLALALLVVSSTAARADIQLFGPGSGTEPPEISAANLNLAVPCREGMRRVVKDSLTSLGSAPGGTLRVPVHCRNGRWAVELSFSDAVMAPAHSPWAYYAKNPLFDNDIGPGGWPLAACTNICIWNDPDFHANGVGFVCPGPGSPNFCGYVSVGVLGSGDSVRIFYVTSSDGIAWALGNGGTPVLSKGNPGDIDSYGVETSSTVDTGIAGSQRYRMCYTVYDAPPATTFYTMACAYSADGLAWTKVPGELSLCAAKVQQPGNPWGYFACAEPSLRYVAADTGREIKLYFTEPRCRKSDCTGFPSADRAIGLAEAPLDWSTAINFTEVDGDTATSGIQPILRQAPEHDPLAGWDGYSTPNVSCDVDDCMMVVSVFKQDAEGIHQRAIATFSSTDGAVGRKFQLDNPAVYSHTSGIGALSYEVRSGSLVRTGNSMNVYFAGNNANGAGQGDPFQIGIFLARRRAP